jgi:hypothetical protein
MAGASGETSSKLRNEKFPGSTRQTTYGRQAAASPVKERERTPYRHIPFNFLFNLRVVSFQAVR